MTKIKLILEELCYKGLQRNGVPGRWDHVHKGGLFYVHMVGDIPGGLCANTDGRTENGRSVTQ